METKNEIFERYSKEYMRGSRKRKGEILNAVCEMVKMHRKAAIRKFRVLQMRDPAKRDGRGRRVYYGNDVTAALKDVWEAGSEVCGELLHSMIGEYVEILRRDKMWKHGDVATGKLLAISERTVKRRVGGFQKMRRGKGMSSTKPSQLKEIIPIFTGPWEGKPPGYGQVDTVVHCGASLQGDMAYTVNYTDAALLWIGLKAQWNKGQEATRESLERIRDDLPFPLLGIHPDTGSEFINWNLKHWCDNEKIEMTRSRPNHKNDNAYVEQKNGHVVRRFLGYVRFDSIESIPVMNKLYRTLCLYLNHFVASRKTTEKVRIGSKYKRKYEKAKTPYQRALLHPAVTDAVKKKLSREHEKLNPLSLKKEVDRLRAKVMKVQKQYGKAKTEAQN